MAAPLPTTDAHPQTARVAGGDDTSYATDPDALRMANAIKQTESGGNYKQLGQSGEAGAYQFTKDTWNSYSQKYLGVPNAQLTPANQDKVAYLHIKELKDSGMNPAQIASVWNSGSPDASGKVGTNQYGAKYNVPQYISKVKSAYEKLKAEGGATPAPTPTPTPTPGVQEPPSSVSSPSVGGFLKNVDSSVGSLLGGLGQAVMHPIKTVEGIGSQLKDMLSPTPAGGDMTDTRTQDEKDLTARQDAILGKFGSQWGSVDAIKKRAYEDPAGLALDTSFLAQGVGGALGKAGEISKVSELSKAGKTVSKVGEAINPVSAVPKLVGAIGKESFAGRTLGGKGYQPEVAAASKELGVKPPVSALTTSKTTQMAEATLSKGLFGRGIVEKVAKARSDLAGLATKAEADATAAIEKATKPYTSPVDLKAVGTTIQKGFDNYQEAFEKTKNELYEAVPKETFKAPGLTTETTEALKEIVAQKKASLLKTPAESTFTKLQKVLSKKTPTIEELRATRSTVGQMLKARTDPFVTGNYAQLEKLYASLSNDMDASVRAVNPQVGTLLDQANAYFRENVQKINSTLGKKIQNSDPEKLVQALVTKNGETQVAKVKEIIGPEATGNLQAAFVNNLFINSMKDGVVNLEALQKNLAKYTESTVKTLLEPEQYAKLQSTIQELQKAEAAKSAQLQKIGLVQGAVSKGTKVAEGSQTAFLDKFIIRGGAALLSFLNPVVLKTLVADIVTEAVATKFFTSQLGEDFLTKGIKTTGETGNKIMQKSAGIGKAAGALYQSQKYSQPQNSTATTGVPQL